MHVAVKFEIEMTGVVDLRSHGYRNVSFLGKRKMGEGREKRMIQQEDFIFLKRKKVSGASRSGGDERSPI